MFVSARPSVVTGQNRSFARSAEMVQAVQADPDGPVEMLKVFDIQDAGIEQSPVKKAKVPVDTQASYKEWQTALGVVQVG